MKRLLRALWLLFFCGVSVVVISLLCVIFFAEIPSVDDIERPDMNLATQLISDDGEVLATYHLENRIFIDYKDISPYMVQAAVATEDVRFYSHSGIDFRRRFQPGRRKYHYPAAVQDPLHRESQGDECRRTGR